METGCKKILWGNKEFLKGIRVLAKLETKLYRSLHHATPVIWTEVASNILPREMATKAFPSPEGKNAKQKAHFP